MRPAYRYEITRFSAVLSLGVLLGLLTDHMLLSLLLALLAYLAEHLYHLLRLIFLSDTRRRIKPPFPGGLWGEIYETIAEHQSRSRKRKRGLVRFAARFREAASAIPDALVILDKGQRVLWANPATRPLLGFGWPESEGRRVTELIAYPMLQEYIEAGHYHRPVDFVPQHNKAIVLSARVTPFGGKKRQRLLVARDITKIYHLNQIRRDFVANVSHELRTPLTVIAGFIENLQDSQATPPRFQRPLELMQNQAQRMRSIIEDLLTLSRLEMDEKASDQCPVDVPALLAEILAEARSLAPQHRLTHDIDPDLWLLGNEAEIRSAFSNLIFNAVRHTPPGTEVRVLWHSDNQGPRLSVRDTGEGIASEHIPRLTERFYRVDKGRSRSHGGTGLGLAIVKHVLNRHEGELLVESRQGVGSDFSCQFPAELERVADRPVGIEGKVVRIPGR